MRCCQREFSGRFLPLILSIGNNHVFKFLITLGVSLLPRFDILFKNLCLDEWHQMLKKPEELFKREIYSGGEEKF